MYTYICAKQSQTTWRTYIHWQRKVTAANNSISMCPAERARKKLRSVPQGQIFNTKLYYHRYLCTECFEDFNADQVLGHQ